MTKIIVVRMKRLMPNIILANQGGFMHNKKITDNVILVQETIHSIFEAREERMIIKLDMDNAFDRVRHSFLFKVLDKFDFISTFVHWITSRVSFPWIAPLVNGWPSYFSSLVYCYGRVT
jgi:hypothetical protein